jgi:HEAT repeat protein
MTCAAAVMGLGLMATLWLRTPTYEGRSIASWLGDLNGKSSEQTEKAEEAIRALGEDAIPTLLDYIGSRDSKAKEKFNEWANDLSLDSLQFGSAYDRRYLAERGFEMLGEVATPAIPKLIPLLADEETRSEVESALESIGPSAVPALIEALRQRDANLREGVVSALSSFKTNAVQITEALKPFQKDPHPKVRSKVMSALYELNKGSEIAFDIFSMASGDPDPLVRCDALDWFGRAKNDPSMPIWAR